MSKCLYCYKELEEGQVDFHPACAKRFFGTDEAPQMPYTRDNMSELAKKVIRSSVSVTGVQEKMSLDLDRGKKNEPAKFTIVGLWGKYIFKPQSSKYHSLPELEDLTLRLAQTAGIKTVEHSLIRLADGELGYITKRIDRDKKGEKISLLDMCQLSNRLTEHKYYGTYQQLADTIKEYSSATVLDLQRYWEVVFFSWLTGNSDMHCKNFSLIDIGDSEYILSPAYDLLAVLLADPYDDEEMALSLNVGGKKKGFKIADFSEAMVESGIEKNRAEAIIEKMIAKKETWFSQIDSSFLTADLKQKFKDLISSRTTQR